MIGRILTLAGASVLMAGAMPAPTLADPMQPVSLGLTGLRSDKGRVLVCLTRRPDYFPDCRKDPDQRHFSVAATGAAASLGQLPPGDYAIAIIHDENANGRLDTFAGIPREGVGFSRNPVLRFGAPGFKSASFHVAAVPVRQDIRVKYFL